jgi:hypothetical protein
MGGLTGAWLQGRNAEQQRTWQAREAAETRFFDERRQAYAALGNAAFALFATSDLYWRTAAEDKVDDQRLDSAWTEFHEAIEAFRVAIVGVQIVGSTPLAGMAREIEIEYSAVTHGPADYLALQNLRNRFLDAAREELAPGLERR